MLSPGLFAGKSLIMRVRDCHMCFNRPNLLLFSPAKTHFVQYRHLPGTPGANNGSGWENIYHFIEFLQYPDFFAYDAMKAGSLRRYFDGLTVLHIAYR